jgi:hypothetical protein
VECHERLRGIRSSAKLSYWRCCAWNSDIGQSPNENIQASLVSIHLTGPKSLTCEPFLVPARNPPSVHHLPPHINFVAFCLRRHKAPVLSPCQPSFYGFSVVFHTHRAQFRRGSARSSPIQTYEAARRIWTTRSGMNRSRRS